MKTGLIAKIGAGIALFLATMAPATARDYVAPGFEAAFDGALGTDPRTPPDFKPSYDSTLARRIAALADASRGRIGVSAIDLASGTQVSVLGDQRFPMASTSKVAIAATFLEGVDQGRWSLSSEFPLLWPVQSAAFSSKVAPVRKGEHLAASQLIDLMLTRSSNPATDALLAAVGGPAAVNDWARRAGLQGFQLDRDIATLVRDDGEFDPAVHIDLRDSSTPETMVQLLAGIYQGRWLSASSRQFILNTMERCRTGTRRIPARIPTSATVAHKTGSLNNTSSDIGIVRTSDGRAIVMAIYVTGQGSRTAREDRIAQIAEALYSGYAAQPNGRVLLNADY